MRFVEGYGNEHRRRHVVPVACVACLLLDYVDATLDARTIPVRHVREEMEKEQNERSDHAPWYSSVGRGASTRYTREIMV